MQFVLTTWAGDKLVAYEPIVAEDVTQVAAYVQGVLSERTRGHEDYLIQAGVRYCLDSALQDPAAYILNPASLQGTWHLVPGKPSARLVRQHGPRSVAPTELQNSKAAKR